MGKTKCLWYVEPLDSDTNEAFDRALLHPEFHCNVADDKKKRHDVLECPLDALEKFCRSRSGQGLRFNVFGRPIYNRTVGPLRDCNFLFFRRRKRKKIARALSL